MIVATKFEVDMTIHCRVVAKFSKSRVWDKDKFQREVPFLEIPKFSYNNVRDSASSFDVIPACDRRSDDDSKQLSVAQ